MYNLTRPELSATLYALQFTLVADRGTMTKAMIEDIQIAIDKLQISMLQSGNEK